MPTFSFDLLRRWPDVEAPELVAVDATDRLVLDHAAEAVRASPQHVVVIGDRHGALTLGAAGLLGANQVRAHQDSLVAERALDANAARAGMVGTYTHHDLGADLVRGARVVLLQLPKSLAALQEITEIIAAHANPRVTVIAGGRVKHMTRSMNDVLGSGFTDVRATLARQKSRTLIATGPRPEITSTFPRREHHDDLGLTVCAHGAAFAGTEIDNGTRFLLGFVDRMAPGAADVVDLGCGTGVIAAVLARSRPQARVLATDDSAAAIASTAATLAANGLTDRVDLVRDDALGSRPPASADLIVCNPPFHLGTTVHDAIAIRLFEGAGRVLRPGGELWTVFNTPLGYADRLRRAVGPTKVVGRDRTFTVTVSRRPRPAPRSDA